MLAREGKRHVGPLQKIVEVGRNPAGKVDRGNVSAHPQGPRGAHGPLEAAVRVFGLVGRKAPRRIKENRLRMNETLIERQTVDEGLQGRPRTSRRDEAVHLPFDRVEIVGASDFGEDFARTRVEKEHGAVSNAVGRKSREVRAKRLAYALFQGRVDGDLECRFAVMLFVGERPVRGVGRKEGKALFREPKGRFERALFQGRKIGIGEKAHREALVRRTKSIGSRTPCDGILRHDRQRRRFRGRQKPRGLAEVHEGGRADPRDVAAPGK